MTLKLKQTLKNLQNNIQQLTHFSLFFQFAGFWLFLSFGQICFFCFEHFLTKRKTNLLFLFYFTVARTTYKKPQKDSKYSHKSKRCDSFNVYFVTYLFYCRLKKNKTENLRISKCMMHRHTECRMFHLGSINANNFKRYKKKKKFTRKMNGYKLKRGEKTPFLPIKCNIALE